MTTKARSVPSSPHRPRRFRFAVPITAYEKSDAPEGRRRRIGGLVTTETEDREGEVILQNGLDFSEFLQHGWFNDNHAKDVAGIVGEPDPGGLRYVKKGDRLPNGLPAPANGHWAEGWLFEDDPRADSIWKKIVALQKSPSRRLGFSIEGTIQKRTGPGNRTIAKAKVRHVAVTHNPVNTDTRLDRLAKALGASADTARRDDDEDELEALAEDGLYLGPESDQAFIPVGGLGARSALGAPASEAAEHEVRIDGVLDVDLGSLASTPQPVGELVRRGLMASGQGRALIPESLESDARKDGVPARGVTTRKSLTAAEAIERVKARYPSITNATAGRVVDLTIELARRGLI